MATRLIFRVHGLHCADEVRLLRQALEGQPGVSALAFDLVAERMEIETDPAVIDASAVIRTVERAGLSAEPWHDDIESGDGARWPLTLGVVSGLSLVAALGAQAWHEGSLLAPLLEHHVHDDAPAVVLGLFMVAAAAGLLSVVPRTWRSLRARRLDMHVLVAVSIAGAVALGEWSEGATVASLFAVANLLEAWSVARARREIAALMRTAPRHAHVVADGSEQCVPAAHVVPGARIVVRPGERIPAAGIVRRGQSTVVAVHGDHDHHHACVEGSRVDAGWQNGEGELEIEVQVRPPESAVARMVEVTEQARFRRAASERWVEQFALYYTPVVLGIALLVTFVPPLVADGSWHEWFYRGLVVTLIACPCALVISTPVTIVAAMASAARRGVLVKGGEFLETAAAATHVALAGGAGSPLAGTEPGSVAAPKGVVVSVLDGPEASASSGHAPVDRSVDVVTALRRRGRVVMVVTNGQADAALLGAASLGMVLGPHGTESAIETADIVSLSPDAANVGWLLAHARHAMQVVKQNVAIAIGAKVLFVTAASLGAATLWMAVAADTGATIAVTFNALRMLRPTRIR